MARIPVPLARLVVLVAALAGIALAVAQLRAAADGVAIATTTVEGTPATVFRPPAGAPAPVVLIAHGFAGSQQLMRPFALTLARAGFIAVTFDFAGHGRNPAPLTGSVTAADGATRTLVTETAKVAAAARALGDGRLAVLGHSMATDIIVRFATGQPDVAATVAVSMFSPAVTATTPRNLLVIAGDWEGGLKREALRAVALAAGGAAAEPFVTYGDVTLGTARRAAFSPSVEHVGVLYSETSLREARAWLAAVFGRAVAGDAPVAGQGPWILLLLGCAVLLAWPIAGLLPVAADRPQGAGLPWRRLALPLLLPAVATPVVLRLVPTHVLPILVGDYLAAHFFTYGVLTALCLLVVRRRDGATATATQPVRSSAARVLAGALVLVAYAGLALAWPIDSFVTSFVPVGIRGGLALALLLGMLPYFLADEWMTRGEGAGRGAYAVSKLVFLVSLALAVALDFKRLFFLLIIIPVIVPFFLVFGLVSGWAYRRTRHPLVAGLANAAAFAFAIAFTFPLLAG